MVRFGREARGERSVRVGRVLEPRERVVIFGVRSGVVRDARALEVAESVVREGKDEVRSAI